MKILRPVDATKRLPEILKGELTSDVVLVRYSDNERVFTFLNEGKWFNQQKVVAEWYEEVEIESLFPDDDTVYLAGETATNKQYVKTMFFQEGASYFKNYILKMLKK